MSNFVLMLKVKQNKSCLLQTTPGFFVYTGPLPHIGRFRPKGAGVASFFAPHELKMVRCCCSVWWASIVRHVHGDSGSFESAVGGAQSGGSFCVSRSADGDRRFPPFGAIGAAEAVGNDRAQLFRRLHELCLQSCWDQGRTALLSSTLAQ
jgi:hypothetical protein